jgi:signal transduction histidine kinase
VTGYSKILRDITERKQAEEIQRVSYERIVEAEREIRLMNQELEGRIAQRTASLEQAYMDLENTNEELRRANDQLQELDRMKSEFVSMVSHALRAPVTNINGAIELLIQSEVAAEDNDRRELIQIIEAESARLTGLVQGVLSVARLEGTRIDLKKEPVNMRTLSEKIVRRLQATTQSHLLSFLCPDDLPDICADANCAEEVLVNLIENAIKYSSHGGHIVVELAEQDGSVITSVTDEGVGIDERELERVFEKFHRVDGSDSGATGGYGLGLYVSKRLVEAMGGTIWARSTVGVGSTVSFTLPVSPKERRVVRRRHGKKQSPRD